jgi:hypothetical protein
MILNIYTAQSFFCAASPTMAEQNSILPCFLADEGKKSFRRIVIEMYFHSRQHTIIISFRQEERE